MRLKHLAAVVLSAALVAGTPAYAVSRPAAPADLPSAAEAHAEVALAKVRELFAAKPTKGLARATEVVGLSDATIALRDLKLSLHDLGPAERREAEAYFARPTDSSDDRFPFAKYGAAPSSSSCGVHTCVHYALTGPEAPPNPVAQVPLTLSTVEHVWQQIVDVGGYQAPLADDLSANNGGSGLLDVYLANLADNGLYGYCTTDDPNTDAQKFKVSAYCVIDNDFAEPVYDAGPLASLQVTVAHEFFHAVQFSYDFLEDAWLMESTAAWIEDEIYDSINDNLQYIGLEANGSPLGRPDVSLDRWSNTWRPYGAWLFWKKLGETFSNEAGSGMPVIVREVWEAAGNPTVSGASTMALTKVLMNHNTTFGKFFHKWGVGNRFPKKAYDEGRRYPKAVLAGKFFLSKSKRLLSVEPLRMLHMSNAHARITPRSSLSGKGWKLRVAVNGPAKTTSPFASIVIYKKSGRIVVVPVKLNRSGNGVKTVPFGRGSVKYVEITVTNASNRFKGCYPQFGYSAITCGGKAVDDRVYYQFTAKVVR